MFYTYLIFQGEYNKSTFYCFLHHQEALERLQGYPGDVEQVAFEVTELAYATCYIPLFELVQEEAHRIK